MTLLNATLSAALIFGVGGLVGISVGICTGAVVQWMLALAAKRDPQAMDVYRRHIHHQKFYPASAWVGAAVLPARGA